MVIVDIEVRCCCSPQKLLGFIRIDEHEIGIGRRIFGLQDHEFPFEKISRRSSDRVFTYSAVKSEHATADELKLFLPGFREATGEEIYRDFLWSDGQDSYRPHGCREREIENKTRLFEDSLRN